MIFVESFNMVCFVKFVFLGFYLFKGDNDFQKNNVQYFVVFMGKNHKYTFFVLLNTLVILKLPPTKFFAQKQSEKRTFSLT